MIDQIDLTLQRLSDQFRRSKRFIALQNPIEILFQKYEEKNKKKSMTTVRSNLPPRLNKIYEITSCRRKIVSVKRRERRKQTEKNKKEKKEKESKKKEMRIHLQCMCLNVDVCLVYLYAIICRCVGICTGT